MISDVKKNESCEPRLAKRTSINWKYKGISSFEKLLSGQLSNISTSGALISGIAPLTEGEKVELRFLAVTPMGNREIITTAKVRRVMLKDEVYYAGVQFDALSDNDKHLISELTEPTN
jgi:hypothetical protein